ncbi:MAG: alginate lyase family protein [Alcaligenaceae bacterium]|nr:alginate lyase family protein [Alcaligenaceae bacterium]
MSLVIKTQTALSLGLFNLWRVAKYRLGIKTGLNPVQKLSATMPRRPFFSVKKEQDSTVMSNGKLKAFGYLQYSYHGNFPDWFYNPLTRKNFPNPQKPWHQLPDFADEVGDIKGIWEASRLDWIFEFVNQEKRARSDKALETLDAWLNDWCIHNPAYIGPNWKCGQETSIRVMHIVASLVGLDRLQSVNNNLLNLIEIHLRRIEPTIDYAIAQDNNHGTSEAAALYIGGVLLNTLRPNLKYQNWQSLGLKWLENRAQKLIMSDGGFSQYSVNYHRVMLDSYSLAEIIRQKLNQPRFSSKLYSQLKKASNWLYVLTQENGDAPNLGANDGARLIPVTSTDYRDFRPSVQLASTLFCDFSYYQEIGGYDEVLDFFALTKKPRNGFSLPDKNSFYHESGLITSQKGKFFLAFKLPVFKFRPSQSDVLHLDLWWNGQNVLRDGGTYSYNTTSADLNYFSGVSSHNTVQFDNHQQMPRLSRFLFGAWLKPIALRYEPNKFSCGYVDYLGCKHIRNIEVFDTEIKVEDQLSGFKDEAVLRWRLEPGSWVLDGNTISNGSISLSIGSDGEFSLALTSGEESRYYYKKTPLTVIEVIVKNTSKVVTLIREL